MLCELVNINQYFFYLKCKVFSKYFYSGGKETFNIKCTQRVYYSKLLCKEISLVKPIDFLLQLPSFFPISDYLQNNTYLGRS